jgi:hypothetical protein
VLTGVSMSGIVRVRGAENGQGLIAGSVLTCGLRAHCLPEASKGGTFSRTVSAVCPGRALINAACQQGLLAHVRWRSGRQRTGGVFRLAFERLASIRGGWPWCSR